MTSHEKREAARHAKETEHRKRQEEQEARDRKKSYTTTGIILAVFVIFAIGIIYLMTTKEEMYMPREIHWHALVDINLCGQHKDLPRAESSDTVHGKAYRGIHLLHTHDDNVIHIEGVIPKKEDIALGRFFDAIEVPFDKDKIMDVKNGDLCNGKPGLLKMYVNDVPSTSVRDYIIAATPDARNQVIKLVFEPEGGMPAKSNSTQT